MGPNGAALATLICYVVVYIIRAVTTRKSIRFNQYPVKVLVNTLILSVQTVFLVFRLPFAYAVQVLGIVLIFIINARPIINGVMRVLRRGKRS
jgi:hypothetical protein